MVSRQQHINAASRKIGKKKKIIIMALKKKKKKAMTTIHQQKVTPPSYFLFGAQTTSVDFAGPANVYVCSTARLTQYNTSHWRGGAIGRGVEMIKHNSERYTIKKIKK